MAITMNRFRTLTVLVLVNLVASILHFGDNVIHFHEYPEPAWIPSAHVVDALWFVITPLLLSAWWLASRNFRPAAIALLVLYGALSMLVLGHFRFEPPSALSFRVNLLIWAEAFAAFLLVVLAPVLVVNRSAVRQASN